RPHNAEHHADGETDDPVHWHIHVLLRSPSSGHQTPAPAIGTAVGSAICACHTHLRGTRLCHTAALALLQRGGLGGDAYLCHLQAHMGLDRGLDTLLQRLTERWRLDVWLDGCACEDVQAVGCI